MDDPERDLEYLLRELEYHNPAIGDSLDQMRQRSGAGPGFEWGGNGGDREWRGLWPLPVIAIAASAVASRFGTQPFLALLICTGAGCLGAFTAILLGRVGTSPLDNIKPPYAETNKPLEELHGLAERTVTRLRTAYAVQVCLVIGVFAGLVGVVIWLMFMVGHKRVTYASAFGSGGVAMLVLSRLKWQPFERMAEARKLADQADALATALRVRMRTLDQIKDPEARAEAQWRAVADYLRVS